MKENIAEKKADVIKNFIDSNDVDKILNELKKIKRTVSLIKGQLEEIKGKKDADK
jgi:hypothetical protein